MRVKQLNALIFLLTFSLGVEVPRSLAQQPVTTASKAERSAAVYGSANSSTLLARMWRGRRAGFSLMPSSRYPTGHIIVTGATTALSLPAVHGIGTVGKISMWTTTGPSGDAILGDSIITQLGGNIGIGTDSPTSKLTVRGMIETTMGGYKFPDGTVQTTAGLTSIFHDSTLEGDGTAASPLRIAVPLDLQAIGLSSSLISARHFGDGAIGLRAIGGTGGIGVIASAAATTGSSIGVGVEASGGIGSMDSDRGGIGLRAFGGFSRSGAGGEAVLAIGGRSESGPESGNGVVARGAPSTTSLAGSFSGGHGVVASGGNGISNVGANSSGGHGVVARGGDSFTDFNGNSLGGHGAVATGGTHTGSAWAAAQAWWPLVALVVASVLMIT